MSGTTSQSTVEHKTRNMETAMGDSTESVRTGGLFRKTFQGCFAIREIIVRDINLALSERNVRNDAPSL